jgi:N6-L-threonylcarbamoyladenine synthase
MRILAIETSCDETAIAILEGTGSDGNAQFRILGNALLSQIEKHKAYGGVMPSLAKREHAHNIVPLLLAALSEAELVHENTQSIPEDTEERIRVCLSREPELTEAFLEFARSIEPPAIDAIAVTEGPGLEPALWVGINTAEALASLWGKPLVPVNHMEGHIISALLKRDTNALILSDIELPVLALLISGGHTELVLMREWRNYKLIGETRDDAVGEAFDKVARMMGLSYPGGPEISKLAEVARKADEKSPFSLPRPMLGDGTCDFSWSGLKTAVLYLLKKQGELTDAEKRAFSREFEDAVGEVLFEKTERALQETLGKTLVIGGGVSANTHLRRVFTKGMAERFPECSLRLPDFEFTTDNAVMIGAAGYLRANAGRYASPSEMKASGTLSLDT